MVKGPPVQCQAGTAELQYAHGVMNESSCPWLPADPTLMSSDGGGLFVARFRPNTLACRTKRGQDDYGMTALSNGFASRLAQM